MLPRITIVFVCIFLIYSSGIDAKPNNDVKVGHPEQKDHHENKNDPASKKEDANHNNHPEAHPKETKGKPNPPHPIPEPNHGADKGHEAKKNPNNTNNVKKPAVTKNNKNKKQPAMKTAKPNKNCEPKTFSKIVCVFRGKTCGKIGSNNKSLKIFKSKCELEKYNCQHNTNYKIVKYNECKKNKAKPIKIRSG